MNGQAARSSRREKSRRHDDDSQASSQDEDEEEKEAKKLKRSSGSRLRQTPRISKRTAVIQSDSDSEDVSSAQGRRSF
jgi:hypothetical protein